jgi:hypothetical protein
MLNSRLLKRLGEAECTPEDGQVGLMDLLSRDGLPIPEGFVLTREAHRTFLGLGGSLHRLQGSAGGNDGAHGQEPALPDDEQSLTENALVGLIREAVLDLGARTVSIRADGVHRRGLGSLSEVLMAIRRAWSLEGPRARGEPDLARYEQTARPILVQRELTPEYTGWSSTEDLRAGPGHPASKARLDRITLHDLGPAGVPRSPPRSLARLTGEAEVAVGGPVRLEWGLEEGRWYVLSASQRGLKSEAGGNHTAEGRG